MLTAKSHQMAERILPVLIYYATVVQKPLTYGELAQITGDFPKALKFGFAVIHRWIEESANKHNFDALPLAVIVNAKDKPVPGLGGIRWRLEANGVTNPTPELIADIFAGERQRIFDFPFWSVVLKDRNLVPYRPEITPIDTIVAEITKRGTTGESLAHRTLKEFIGAHPESVGLPKQAVLLGYEITLPSLDRADVVFRHKGKLYPIEVKSHEADEVELTRGIYQTIKYQCLFTAERKDAGDVVRVEAMLACGRLASNSEKLRCHILGVQIIDGIIPIKSQSV